MSFPVYSVNTISSLQMTILKSYLVIIGVNTESDRRAVVHQIHRKSIQISLVSGRFYF